MGALRISELAQLAAMPVSTLRYYERIGLLPAPDRSQNGYRVYDESAIEHLAFIGRAKRMGVPLDEVSELIELWSTGGCRPLQERIRSFLTEKITAVRAQRLELAEFERQLEGLVGRLDTSAGSSGLCDLDCSCVHLDSDDDTITTCARFPTMSRGETSCALEEDARAERVAEWRDLIAQGEVEQFEDGLRVAFDRSTEITEQIARLCAEEVQCCSFFTFNIEITVLGIALRVGVPDRPEAKALSTMIFGPRPEARMR